MVSGGYRSCCWYLFPGPVKFSAWAKAFTRNTCHSFTIPMAGYPGDRDHSILVYQKANTITKIDVGPSGAQSLRFCCFAGFTAAYNSVHACVCFRQLRRKHANGHRLEQILFWGCVAAGSIIFIVLLIQAFSKTPGPLPETTSSGIFDE